MPSLQPSVRPGRGPPSRGTARGDGAAEADADGTGAVDDADADGTGAATDASFTGPASCSSRRLSHAASIAAQIEKLASEARRTSGAWSPRCAASDQL